MESTLSVEGDRRRGTLHPALAPSIPVLQLTTAGLVNWVAFSAVLRERERKGKEEKLTEVRQFSEPPF